ncbi:MAG: site-specific tyrosine recombinase XerC [Acidobacteriota bacterium]|mgnify:CR=1 FL=1
MRFKPGYDAIRRMQAKALDKRGGSTRPADGLNRQDTTMAFYADQFLMWLLVHNRTPAGVESRRWDLHPFLIWAEERDLIYPQQISRSILESYQRWLWQQRKKNGKPLGVRTQVQRLVVLRVFFSWLCRQRILEANPASEIELPRVGQRLPAEPLTIPEIETILSQPDLTNPLGVRDRAMLELFYSTGIRRTELARLNIGDLNREKAVLFIRQGKGQKDRVVPVGRRALQWLEKYLEDIRPRIVVKPQEQALFLNGYGETLGVDALSRKVTDYIQQAGIRRAGSCHLLRHTCATHMLEGGADIRYIQQLLGHSKLDTTAIYTQVSIQKLQAVHALTHPAERKKTTVEPSP